jgi:hypothetical protein
MGAACYHLRRRREPPMQYLVLGFLGLAGFFVSVMLSMGSQSF